MSYVQVPKDLTKVKTKVLLNLTKRQLICFSLAAIIGIPFYLLTKGALGSTVSAGIMVVIMLPFFFFAMYEKDGRPLEVILQNILQAKLLRPGVRPYKTRNIYAVLQDEIYEKEVLGIVAGDYEKADRKFKAGKKKSKNKSGKTSGKTAGKCSLQSKHKNG